jgi:uncharacterized membrane protein
VALALLGLGVFFRFAYLADKVYGLDETFTSLRISGYSEAEAVQDLSRTRILGVRELDKYQRYRPEKSILGTINGLAAEEPQHPPLYYVLARLWAGWLGDVVAVTRTLPALLSLLAFPCVFWLCRELFAACAVAWVAVALLAVSPFHVAYAQEARQYSLWTVATLFSSAALLRALRLGTRGGWLLYAAALALSFYTFLLSALVAVGHGLYVAVTQRFRLNRTSAGFLAAGVLAVVPFLPWVAAVAGNWSRVQHTTNFGAAEQVGVGEQLASLARGWTRHPGRVFFDLNVSAASPPGHRLLQMLFTGLCLAVVAYALYRLARTTDGRPGWFVYTLLGVPALGLVLQDVLLKGQGGGASVIPRYVIPCYLAFQLAVAYLLGGTARKGWLRGAALAVLLGGGVYSCATYAGSRVWWNKGGVAYLEANLSAARVINASPRPLAISDCDTWGLLFTSHLLEPNVRLLVKPHCFSCKLDAVRDLNPDLATVADGFSAVFLFPAPSDDLCARLGRQSYPSRPIALGEYPILWQVEGSF